MINITQIETGFDRNLKAHIATAKEILAESGDYKAAQKTLTKCDTLVNLKDIFITNAKKVNFNYELIDYLTLDLTNSGMVDCQQFKWLTMSVNGFNKFLDRLSRHIEFEQGTKVRLAENSINVIEFLRENFGIEFKLSCNDSSVKLGEWLKDDNKFFVYFDLVNYELHGREYANANV